MRKLITTAVGFAAVTGASLALTAPPAFAGNTGGGGGGGGQTFTMSGFDGSHCHGSFWPESTSRGVYKYGTSVSCSKETLHIQDTFYTPHGYKYAETTKFGYTGLKATVAGTCTPGKTFYFMMTSTAAITSKAAESGGTHVQATCPR